LELGGRAFEHVNSRVIWDGAMVKLTGATARVEAAGVTTQLEADLTGSEPSYHAAGSILGMPWKGGKVDADVVLDTSGSGTAALANLRAEGSFRAKDIDTAYPSIAGCFQFAISGNTPRVKLSSLQLSDGEEKFTGSGATSADGELMLDIAGVPKPVRLTLR